MDAETRWTLFVLITVALVGSAIPPSQAIAATTSGGSVTPTQTTFQKVFDGGQDDGGFSVLQDAGGNYVSLGTTNSFGAGESDLYLQKTDTQGKSVWVKSFGGASSELGYHVASTSDGGYVLAGETWTFGAGNVDAYVVKTDGEGNVQWSKAYGTPTLERIFSARQTSDGGFILVGYSQGFATTDTQDVFLAKITSTGDVEWVNIYDGLLNEQGYYAEQTSDEGYIVTGRGQGHPLGFFDLLLMKTDGSGRIQWANAYGGAFQEQAYSVHQLEDGSYLVAGFNSSSGAGSGDCYLMKVNNEGSVQWAKTYGGVNNELCYSAQSTSDGGYLLSGSTGSFGAGNFDGYLVKTDGSGNLQWSKAYGGSNLEFGIVGQETSDGGYVLGGVTRSFGATGDSWLVKTDGDGNSGCHETAAATVVRVVSPPTTSLALFVSSGGMAADAETQVGTPPGGIPDSTLCSTRGNGVPDAVNDSATAVNGIPVTINVLANDSDPDGDPLTVTSVSDPPHGTAVINPNQTVTYDPECAFQGTETFTYTIDDGYGGTDTATVSVRVRKTSRRGSIPC